MSGTGKIEWYLARDGQQHGPLSQVELDKFIELGHLRPADLLWRVGFDDWQAAADVFPLRPPEPASAPVPEPPAPSAPLTEPNDAAQAAAQQDTEQAAGHDHSQTPQTHAPQGEIPAGPVQSDQSVAPDHASPEQTNAGPSLGAPSAVTQRPDQLGAERNVSANPTFAPGALGPGASGPGAPGAMQNPAARPGADADAGQRPGLGANPLSAPVSAEQPVRPTQPQFDVAPSQPLSQPLGQSAEQTAGRAVAQGQEDAFLDDDEPPSRSGWLLVAAALFVAVMLGAAGLFAYNNEKMITAFIGDLSSGKPDSAVTVIKAPSTAPREAAGQVGSSGDASAPVRTASAIEQTAPVTPAAPTSQELPELPLLKSKLWQFAQREFGDWTDQRLAELRKLSAEAKSREETNQYLVESFVRFRRQNAAVALGASPENLAEIAGAFVESLKALTTKGPQPCYAYISNGESTPELAKLYFEPDIGTKLEAQMLAIMKAVANGKASSPQTRKPPTEADFNKLSSELGKRGWTAKDLKLFSDPNALSEAEPKLVCRLVTEWFAAQTQLPDQTARDLLIAASLRPVIGG